MTIRANGLEEAATLIPHFNGTSLPLDEYFSALDSARSLINNDREEELANIAKSKLLGEAKILATTETFESLGDIKFFLATYFG